MDDQFLNVLVNYYRHLIDPYDGRAVTFATGLADCIKDHGYTIVRTADLDLAERKSAHGCTDALCGDCDQ